MNVSYIKKLIRLVEESDIESLEVSTWGRTVKIIHRGDQVANGNGHTAATVVQTAPTMRPADPPAEKPVATPEPVPAASDDKLVPITSPMVGTYYSSPAPDAAPYVSLNEKISVGQVVCIVEAMKLMNEIESEVSGRIAKIMVENAQPVEFGQTLFLIDPE